MKTIKNYTIFLFITTMTRNIIDIYSIIYLYQKSFSIKSIIGTYVLVYFIGIFISRYSILIGNKIGYKYILMLSTIVTSITFYIMQISNNIYLIATFLSLSLFTYHPIRHCYGIKLLKNKKDISKTLIYTYIAQLLSSYIVIKKISFIYLIIISIIGIIPTLFIKKESSKKIKYPHRISNNKLNYFFYDQFKIIFLLLEPLYLYLISNNISYVGLFSIILTISSIVCIYYIVNKINIYNNYQYINIIFTLILIIKLNADNKNLLLIIALLEGIGIKINELISNINLYDYNQISEGYIIVSETIFCLTRTLILGILYFLPISLKSILYILLVGVFLLSFQYKKDTT